MQSQLVWEKMCNDPQILEIGQLTQETNVSMVDSVMMGSSPSYKMKDTGGYGHGRCAANPQIQKYWTQWDSLTITDGVLCRQFYQRDGSNSHT